MPYCERHAVRTIIGEVCPHCWKERVASATPQQSDAEIGALVRAAIARYHAQPGCDVELERVVSVEPYAVLGPGFLIVKHECRLKPGVRR